MKKKTKTLILSIVVTLILLLTFTITYAAFAYIQTGNDNQQLVLGDIYMHYTESNGINLQGALPGDEYSQYFEFTISGKNTYKQKDIYYDFKLTKGDVPQDKTEDNRIPDKYLKFKLTKVNEDNSETVLFTDQTYDDLTNQTIYVETIAKNTTTEVNNTYRLYMVISEKLVLGNTSDAVMTNEEFGNVFASIKVNVTGDFNKKVVAKNFVSAVKSRYGIDTTLVAVNTDGDLYDGTGAIREYRYSGPTASNYVFFDTDGDGTKEENEIWRIIGVFEDNGEEKVKLVRNTVLQDAEMPTSYLIDGTTYAIKASGIYAYWNNVTSGTYPSTNQNDWTTAGLQYYLNTEKDETDTSSGATANTGYLSLLTSEAKELISPTTYYLGNVYYMVDTVKNAYNQERGTVECASSVTGSTHNNSCNIWNGNQASWYGQVALLYSSDYGYSASNLYWETDMYGWNGAESDGVVASSTSWMQAMPGHSRNAEWLLSPSSYSSNYAINWCEGYVSVSTLGSNIEFRPVLHLKSQAKVIDGAGTLEEPFEIVTE